jgi:nicotinamide-nucleotide amidase
MPKEIIRQVHNLLLKNKKTVAVAESCTGGELSSLLTRLPDASKYFLLGAITYSNQSKTLILNISRKIITQYGAVSEKTALLMAKNIRRRIRADFGISITGIAGPGGASQTKPKGTVYIGLAGKNIVTCRKFIFSGSRQVIRKKACREALRLLCAHLSP